MRKYAYLLESITSLTPTVFEIRLVPAKGAAPVDFQPGQYVSFSYQHDGFSAPVRSFSMTNVAGKDGALEFGVRRMGKYTQALENVPTDAKFDVYGPAGSFAPQKDLDPVFLAAGIGITPFIGILRDLAKNGFTRETTLIYSCKSAADVPYLKELQQLASTHNLFKFKLHLSDDSGLITIKDVPVSEPGKVQYLLCGPAGFMQSLTDSLLKAGIGRANIRTESFSQSVSAKKEVLFFLGLIPVIFALLFFIGHPLPDFASTWARYLTRSAGLTAEILLVLTVAMGIGMVVGYTHRLFEPVKAWAVHRALGISFFISILVHVASILFDKFRGFGLADVLIPFVADFKPLKIGGIHLGSFWTALGITAFYLSIVVIYTSLVTIDKNQKIWRWLHYCNYLIAPLIFFHALFNGTDFSNPIVQWFGLGLVIFLTLGMMLRLGRRNKRVKPR